MTREEILQRARDVVKECPGRQAGAAARLGVTQVAISRALKGDGPGQWDDLRLRILAEVGGYTIHGGAYYDIAPPPKRKRSAQA